MNTVYILLARGFEESEAIVPADLLKRAGANVVLVAAEGGLAVPGAHGITVSADITIDELRKEDMSCLVLPGGALGTQLLGDNPRVLSLIEYAASRGLSSPLSAPHRRYSAKCVCLTAETRQFIPILHLRCNMRT